METASTTFSVTPHAAFGWSKAAQQGDVVSDKPGKAEADEQRPDEASRSDYAAEQALSEEEQRQLEQLENRDREVRDHEAAHLAAGGNLVRGGMSFSFQVGPDGKRYAVGGEVSIDSSPVNGDPQATLEKARQIQAAALAPVQPSAQDRIVAAKAAQMAMEARLEMAQQKTESVEEGESSPKTAGAIAAYQGASLESQDSILDQMV